MSFVHFGTLDTGNLSLLLFIMTITTSWIILVLFFLRKKGWLPTLRYFLPMMIAAAFFEAAAVANGRYYYPGYLFYIDLIGGSVPLVILFGWAVNLVLLLWMSKTIISYFSIQKKYVQILCISLLTGILGIFLDVFEDPLAYANHWWIWTETTRLPTFFNVPLTNYLDWFLILFTFSLAIQLIDQASLTDWRKLNISINTVPLLGSVIYVIHTLVTFGL